MGYALGLIGMWIFCDGIISIRLYYNAVNENGIKLQNWKYDHSIRILRCIGAIVIIVIGGIVD